MLSLIVLIGIAFLLQGFFSFMQMRNLSNAFIEMRRNGRVAFGRKSGGFHAGAVVMFRLNEDGIICEGKKLEGLTSFSRVKPLTGFEGRHIESLTAEDGPKNHRNLCRAIEDAALTYRKYTNGEVIEEPTTFQKAQFAVRSLVRNKINA